ncbi:RNA polymerase sigma-70 factor, ECF subfamily [Cyclobacterium lianum]|uniref:RNA polymerase sigma-70 factor, ECF subfamily n=1 Tax=Cyclobacterium lianum TaxID=388280 RepID=A0A1M7LDM6_9BACT|nr:RNA polymerase sigma-70 factor [Cyclobacterium lianum]SHM76154.1 RNA polymerase sigma-70 factor, ECF subfamily [Cyclobacterium lianum]
MNDLDEVRKHSKRKESEIVLLLRQGDKSAFDELYQRYVDKMLGFADTFLGDPDESEEVVQVIFVNIWEKRKQLDPGKNIGAYLFRSLKNQILNHLRNISRHCQLTAIPVESQMDGADILRQICVQESKLQVMSSIGEMPEVQQRVFLLSRVEGMSNREIAKKLKLSVRTIEHHLYLGKKFFKGKNLDKLVFIFCFGIYNLVIMLF